MKNGDKISADEMLYRRGYSSPEKKYLNPDGTPTSRVFKLRAKDEGKLSMGLARLTTPAVFVGDSTLFNVFEISNNHVENIDLYTIFDGEHNKNTPAHCLIIGMEEEDDAKPAYLAKNARKINF